MEIKMKKKVCTGCNKEKSLTEYYKDKSAKNGLRANCKECRKAYNKKYYQENKEYVKACRKKYYQENLEKEKAYKKKWREENKEKERARSKKWREENSEYDKAYKKKYREENQEQIKARHKKWREENPERQRAINRLSSSKRRARKLNTQVEAITDELLKEHWIKKGIDPHRCFYCEDRPYEHLEHCIPLSRGGTHTKDNLVPACASCNLSKGTKTPDEWEG